MACNHFETGDFTAGRQVNASEEWIDRSAEVVRISTRSVTTRERIKVPRVELQNVFIGRVLRPIADEDDAAHPNPVRAPVKAAVVGDCCHGTKHKTECLSTRYVRTGETPVIGDDAVRHSACRILPRHSVSNIDDDAL